MCVCVCVCVCVAVQTLEGLAFSRSHHVVEKATLYDMDLDSSRTHAAIACQDRNIRLERQNSFTEKQKWSSNSETEVDVRVCVCVCVCVCVFSGFTMWKLGS